MGNSETLDRLLSEEQRREDERTERRAVFIQYASIIIMLALVLIVVWGFITSIRQPTIKWVEIKDVRVIGETNVCRGQRLLWEYNLAGEGIGTLVIDGTSVKLRPPSTVVFSDPKKMVVSGRIEEKVVDFWQVPSTHIDPQTGGSVPFPAGQYLRRISVSSPSRSSVIDVVEFEFSVKEDCPQ